MDRRRGDKRKIKLEGQTFNYLFVKNNLGYGKYLCVCTACGTETEATSTQLKNRLKKSCGCLHRKLISDAKTKHGKSHTKLYRLYKGIIERCYRPTDENKKRNYYDKNIRMCDEWKNNYLSFEEWALSNGYRENLTIDRINNNKGYSPDNCRWITREQQASNRRTNRMITIGNETHTMSDWCNINNVSYNAACKRIEAYGWDEIKAVSQPTRTYVKNRPFSRKNSDMLASKVDDI